MRKHLENVFKAPGSLPESDLAASVRAGLAWSAGAAVLLLVLAAVFAAVPVDPEGPWALIQATVRVGLSALVLGCAKFVAVVLLGVGAFQVLENSEVGQRVGRPGMLLGALLVAAGLVFGGGR